MILHTKCVAPLRRLPVSRILIFALTSLCFCSGCTALTLEHYTLEQVQTIDSYRIQSVLHCLAMVASDQNSLPTFSVVSQGVTTMTDSGSISSTTEWTRLLNSF